METLKEQGWQRLGRMLLTCVLSVIIAEGSGAGNRLILRGGAQIAQRIACGQGLG